MRRNFGLLVDFLILSVRRCGAGPFLLASYRPLAIAPRALFSSVLQAASHAFNAFFLSGGGVKKAVRDAVRTTLLGS